MRKYQKVIKKLKELSEEKLNYSLHGLWTNYTLLYILVFLVIYDISVGIYLAYGFVLWFILILIIYGILMFLLLTRTVGIGITKNRLVYVVFTRLGYKEKRTYEIPYEKIKYIVVKKQLGNINVKMSFISDVGKLEKIKFNFKTMMIASESFNNSSKAIYKKLLEIQKVVDKGDF